MRNNRSVMFISAIALILLAMIPAVSAETILSETPVEYSDTSVSVVQPGNSQSYEPDFSINGIYFKNIELYDLVSYITIDIAGNKHAEGRYTASYSLGPHTDSAVIYVSHATNIFGVVTHTRYVIFPQNWDNSGLINAKTMTFSDFVFYTTYGRNDPVASFHPSVCVAAGGKYVSTTGTKATISVTSASIWTNQILVNHTNEMYEIILTRNLDGTSYPSTLTIKNDESTVYTHTGSDDRQVFYADNEVTDIVINSGVKDYTYSLTTPPGDPDDPGDPSRVMVHIIAQDARNENLLLGAAVEVRDQTGTVVATGSTSPDGWMVFEYDLPATLSDEDFERYYAVKVTHGGWTQKVPDFKFYPAFIPRSGDWIRVEMLPDTAGPADPDKTYLMFFVRDIHSNPLERASVEIAGNFWHTNSAGHVAVEVAKNSTTAYTVRKTGHVSISGSATVGAEGSHTINIALGPALPDRTPGPGDHPGATPPPGPTPDRRTNEEKGQAVIDMVADNAEGIGALALICLLMGLLKLMVKW